ncbi:hypothetical protein FZC83_02255 [Rossellomorea marisflavi]|uniref:FtsK domain-containing protein n=1 Tax=Rossellomorea marisflavi TaxID=189381 RepID=A0A5D4S0G0_9BACI|nr:FtsK/SpoIIIE domain-containing protein [Rossellomorea marisflavi]TYS56419.1 hypothetical protein FZC83_02255 [Rossellomorea marisflavi]
MFNVSKQCLTNKRSNAYKLSEINTQTLHSILESRFIAEGVYSLNTLYVYGVAESYLITPSFDKYSYEYMDIECGSVSDSPVNVIQLKLKQSSMFPLDTLNCSDLLSNLSNFTQSPFICQVLFTKKKGNWRENQIQMYETYLKGVDDPESSKLFRKLQTGVVGVLNKIGGFSSKSPIAEVEEKILRPNYIVEIRFGLFLEGFQQEFSSFLTKITKNSSLFNHFEPILMNTLEGNQLMSTNSLSSDNQNQLLSDQELFALLLNNPLTDVVNVKPPIAVANPTIQSSLSSFLSVMPKTDASESPMDSTIPTQINKVFKRVGITKFSLKVVESFQGSSLHKTQFEIPSTILYSQFTKKMKDIQSALGSESVGIEMGSKPDTVDVFTPLQNRGTLLFRNVLESAEFEEFKSKSELPFVIGEKATGGYQFACLAALRHLMVTGATGSGKSVSVNLIILSLLLNVPPEELVLYLIDPKMVEFSLFDGFPQVKEIITDMDEAESLLANIVVEMEKRYSTLSSASCKNIKTYNEKNPDSKMPYLVVVIDEYADLQMTHSNVEDHIVRLGQKARAAGIHLIISTQRPSVDIMTGVIKANLPSTLCYRLKTSADYKTVFGKTVPFALLGRGDGVAVIEGQIKEFERFQSPILTEDEKDEDRIYQELKNMFKGVESAEVLLEENQPVAPLDRLKSLIANGGIKPIAEIQKEMGIGINLVSDLMKSLVEEGFLGREGRKYIVVATEDELKNWRGQDEKRLDHECMGTGLG